MSIFSKIPKPYVPKSKHNLSHPWLGTIKMGKLIPFYVEDIVPSDYINLSTEMKIKFDPLTAPIMTNIDAFVSYWFVPYRLIWNNAEDFFGIYQTAPDPSSQSGVKSAPIMPKTYIPSASGVVASSLADYMGLPANFTAGQNTYKLTGEFSALPFRAYHLIYNEFFRDGNLQEEFNIYKGDYDPEMKTNYSTVKDGYAHLNVIHNRAWRKDYFTSALPFPQRGPEVTLPVSGTAAIRTTNNGKRQYLDFDNRGGTTTFNDGSDVVYARGTGTDQNEKGTIQEYSRLGASGTDSGGTRPLGLTNENMSKALAYDNSKHLYTDLEDIQAVLDNAVSPNVNEYRRAFAIQRWLEALARAGSRYTEQLRGVFGVSPDDARLQRPQFLGANRIPIMVSEVVQTSATESGANGSAQGNLAGYAGAVSMNGHFKRRFKEHGVVIGIMCVAPQPVYASALQRFWLKDDVLDFGWPQFSNLGEQEIWQGEIWPYASDSDKKNVFGYAPRYAEYKYHPSSVHGDFVNQLNYWHLARQFSSSPNLNSDFIQIKPADTSRIFADVSGETDQIQVQLYNRIRSIRPFTKFGIPV